MLIVPEQPRCETVRVPVIKVFDGDGFLTRVIDPVRQLPIEASVRFGFIDAPEMEQPGGQEAKDFLSSLIADRWLDLVVLTKSDTGKQVDRHGRIVCIPYLTAECENPSESHNGLLQHLASWFAPRVITRNIELEMVLNGWAWVLDRYGPDESYFEALEDARRWRRGIWAYQNNVHPWEFKKQKYRQERHASVPVVQPSLISHKAKQTPCPNQSCGGHLVPRSGKFGDFTGCSKFPNCKHSQSSISVMQYAKATNL